MSSRLSMRLERLLGLRLGLWRLLPVLGRLPLVLDETPGGGSGPSAPRWARRLCCINSGSLAMFAAIRRASSSFDSNQSPDLPTVLQMAQQEQKERATIA